MILKRLPTVGMGRSPSQLDHLYLLMSFRLVARGGLQCLEPLIRKSVCSTPPYCFYPVAKLFVRSASAHHGLQVMAAFGEEAGYQLAVGGETGAGAARAERLCNRGDDPDIATTIEELEVHRWRSPCPPAVFDDRIPGPDNVQYLSLGNHVRGLPMIAVAHIHELDESQAEGV